MLDPLRLEHIIPALIIDKLKDVTKCSLNFAFEFLKSSAFKSAFLGWKITQSSFKYGFSLVKNSFIFVKEKRKWSRDRRHLKPLEAKSGGKI